MTAPPSARAFLVTTAKAAITVVTMAIVVSQINFAFLFSHGHKLSAFTLLTCLALLALETSLIASLRLKLVLESMGQERRLDETFQVALGGFFFEQVAFGFVGGDAMRLWLLHHTDVPLRTAFQAIVVDRCLGSIGLLLLALFGLPGLIVLLTGYELPVIAAAGAVLVAVGAVFAALLLVRAARRFRTPPLAEMVEFATAAIHKSEVRNRLLLAFVLAMLAHAINVFIFFLLGRDLAISLSLGQWFFIVPPALLVSMLPISAGGWGLREASFVVALASFGIAPEQAVIAPIAFGLGVLVVTLPGGLVWLVSRKRARRRDAHASSVSDARTSGASAGIDCRTFRPLSHQRPTRRAATARKWHG